MRRLGGLLSGLLIGSILVSVGSVFALLAPEGADGTHLRFLGVAGAGFSALAAAWIAYLEGTFPGLNAKKVTRGLVMLGAALPFVGASLLSLGNVMGRGFLAGSLLATAWGVLQLLDALRGPARPAWVPADFTALRRGLLYPPILRGMVESQPASVEYSNAWNGQAVERSVVACPLPDPNAAVEMTAPTVIGALVVGARQKTGDVSFDSAVYVRGPHGVVLAVLDAGARAAVQELVAAGGSYAKGELRGDARAPLALLARAAKALASPASVLERLRANALADPVPGVRLACLQCLFASAEGRSEALAVSKQVLGDPDARVRVLGAAVLAFSSEKSDRERAREALLASTIGLGALVADLLDHADGAVAGALVHVLDEHGGPDALPALQRFAARAQEPILRERAERAAQNIEERAVAEKGRISLAADDSAAGALSEASDAGRLALVGQTRKPTSG